jgi:tetratricopeptide (TPR) repeat protein
MLTPLADSQVESSGRFMRRVAMFSGLVLAAGLAVFVSSVRAQTSEDVNGCYKEISPDQAINSCTRAIGAGQLSASSLAIIFTNRGNAYNSKGDYDRAIQDFSQAIRLDPKCAYAFNGLGNAYNGEADYDQAIQNYDRAIRLIANYGYAFNGRGNAYHSKGDYDRAIQDYDQAIRFTPNYANAFNGRGNAYNSKGDYDRAIEDYDQAIRYNPNYAYAFNGRGNAHNHKGDYDRAIQDFDQAIHLNPNFAYAFNGRGNSYNDKGNYDRAIQDYDQAVRLTPNYADAFFNRGNAYNHKGDYDRAIQDYDQAIRLNPNFADAFFNRGFTRFKEGPTAMAVPDFAKSAELVPANRYNILWVYVAAARARQNPDDALLNAQGVDLVSWPGPVLSLFLKKSDRNALLEEARDPDVEKEHDRLCEAHFFLAEYELLAGVEKAAEADFQEAVDTCRPTVVEYSAAAAELKRLPVQSPSRSDASKKPDVSLK